MVVEDDGAMSVYEVGSVQFLVNLQQLEAWQESGVPISADRGLILSSPHHVQGAAASDCGCIDCRDCVRTFDPSFLPRLA